MKKTSNVRSCYRAPKTYRELRLLTLVDDWEDEFGKIHTRGRRRFIPTDRDDVHTVHQRTWKHMRKTQYRLSGTRSVRHELYMPNENDLNFYRIRDTRIVRLREYLVAHDIPHQEEVVREPYYLYSELRQKWMLRYKILGYNLTWWSPKDIGVEYV